MTWLDYFERAVAKGYTEESACEQANDQRAADVGDEIDGAGYILEDR